MNTVAYYQSLSGDQRACAIAYETCAQQRAAVKQAISQGTAAADLDLALAAYREVQGARVAVLAQVTRKAIVSKTVWVDAYTRKSGVKVKGHWRTVPVR